MGTSPTDYDDIRAAGAPAECLEAGFTPEARGMRPAESSCPLLEFMSWPTAAPVGLKAMHPLIKLQAYNGLGSLETFSVKFQHMAAYLQWDNEDTFHHICASLEGAAGQVFWDVGPRATTSDLVCLLQTRFGTQLQAECFKA